MGLNKIPSFQEVKDWVNNNMITDHSQLSGVNEGDHRSDQRVSDLAPLQSVNGRTGYVSGLFESADYTPEADTHDPPSNTNSDSQTITSTGRNINFGTPIFSVVNRFRMSSNGVTLTGEIQYMDGSSDSYSVDWNGGNPQWVSADSSKICKKVTNDGGSGGIDGIEMVINATHTHSI